MAGKPLVSIAATILGLGLVLGWSGGARAADPVKLVAQTDWAPHGMVAGLLLAEQNGWFKDAGLDVTVLDGKGSNTTILQTASGQVDVGFAQLSAMAAGISNGLPVIAVMGLVQAGDGGLMVPANSGWNSLRDLKGKRILVPAGSGTATFLGAFVEAGGMSLGDFTISNVDSSAQVSLYVTGKGDAALQTVSYFLPMVQKLRPAKPILFSSVGLRVPGYGLLIRKSALEDKDGAMRKFVEVEQRAWSYIFAGHQKEAIDAILAQRPGMQLDPDILMAQMKLDMPYFVTPATQGKPLGWQAESDWQTALKTMGTAGLVKAALTPADIFSNRFISDRYVIASK